MFSYVRLAIPIVFSVPLICDKDDDSEAVIITEKDAVAFAKTRLLHIAVASHHM